MKTFILSLFVISSLFISCSTTNQSSFGSALSPKSQVANILNTGSSSAFSIFGNTNDFLTNALIEAVMPKELKDINNKLIQLGLTSVVNKQKEIIGEVALKSLTTMKPLISNAINEITLDDAIIILKGGKGAATNYLKTKTETQLIKSLTPTVTNELNKLGLNKLMSSVTGGNSNALNQVIGTLLNSKTIGSGSSKIEDLVTSQLVNGLYNVVLDSEKNNNLISNGVNSILKGLSN